MIMKRRIQLLAAVICSGCLMIGTSMISFAADWEQVGNDWYYRKNDGEYLKSSWLYSNGCNYYLGADGKMLTGEHTVIYRTCKFDDNGALVEESVPTSVEGLDLNILAEAHQNVQESWPAIVKGYDMICAERANNGAAAEILNYDLCVAAAYRSREMQNMMNTTGDLYYSGPEENGEMRWNTVPRLLTGNSSYIGTENKSMAFGKNRKRAYLGINDMEFLLSDQFTSEPHYAQIIGKEYGQIGLAILYTDDQGSFRITEVIKVGE